MSGCQISSATFSFVSICVLLFIVTATAYGVLENFKTKEVSISNLMFELEVIIPQRTSLLYLQKECCFTLMNVVAYRKQS